MKISIGFGRKSQTNNSNTSLTSSSPASLNQSFRSFISSSFHLVFKLHSFWFQLTYFIVFSLIGYTALKIAKPKPHTIKPNNIDMFFTSVSAVTVSSMSSVEMEVFSNAQLIILTILMLIGGEVFTSMLELQLFPLIITKQRRFDPNINIVDQIELGKVSSCSNVESTDVKFTDRAEHKGIKYLAYAVLGYLLIVHTIGSGLVSMYISLIPSARHILKTKQIQIQTLSVFTVVSTFANCGFVPTNENMVVFKNNSGLLLLLIPQILIGNTLYPVCLRVWIWVLGKITGRKEYGYTLKNYKEMGYGHLMSSFRCCLLAGTVFGFILVQLVLFCLMEWNSEALDGLSSYQKLVGSLFQVVNSRHTGESIVDLSSISSAILVMFVVMMYLPPYTSFIPIKYQMNDSSKEKSTQHQGRNILESILFSQLSYLAILIILVCITEREKIKEDPLNFNVLNITIEVISAYGNVGFSTGYSCKRRLKSESLCIDTWAGFVGRWSGKGKFILIVVMFFGRLKKMNMKGGKAWKLS